MQFAAGMSVFPGGGVEPRDYLGTRAWSGPEPGWWPRFGIGVSARHAYGGRAELFEETGVLVGGAGHRGRRGVARGRPPPRRPPRARRGEGDLDGLLEQYGLVLAAHLLRPWDRWTTPVGPPRRYDTLFFVAALPEGAEPDAVTSEAHSAEWIRAEDAAHAGTLGHQGMLRPTLHVLADLATAADVAEVLERPRSIVPGGLEALVTPEDLEFC